MSRDGAGPASFAANWPVLSSLRLGAEAEEVRRGGIGGSDANIIFSGDPEKLLDLWRLKRGEKDPDDLSKQLAVVLGCWTEPFNRQWYEQHTGQTVSSVGEVITCSKHEWRRCSLDGRVKQTGAIWEGKHTNAFAKTDDVLERYMPQLQHNMAVAGVESAILSVIFGNHKYEIFEVVSDWLYQLELFEAEQEFWDCVQNGREPVPARPPAPPRPVGTREICLEGNNAWANAAADWLENRTAAKKHASAVSLIKELIDDDVGRAFGHGIEAKRSKTGAVTIRELG